MLGNVAGTTGDRISVEGLGAIPGKDILVRIQRTTKGTPVVPVFGEGIGHVRLFVATIPKLEEVFLRQAAGDVILGSCLFRRVGFGAADEAHEV